MLTYSAFTGRAVLIGLESSGKTTLFSRLGGNNVGDETNVKGSTYSIRIQNVEGYSIVDTPGIRSTDKVSNSIAIREMRRSNKVILVVRGTHFQEEMNALLPLIQNVHRSVVVIVTYADKMTSTSKEVLVDLIAAYKLPLFVLDTRTVNSEQIHLILESLQEQELLSDEQRQTLLNIELDKVEPKKLLLDHPLLGAMLSIISLVGMFLLPVLIAYWFSNGIQPLIEENVISPLVYLFDPTHSFIQSIFIGDYGMLTLGIYSFIWAFPVVFLVGCSTAFVDETGIKDRIIDALNPILRKIGLNGRDLIPVLSGFGCNVVAVLQSRTCSLCTRKQCVSFITFGAACSYQIGATLSIFNSAHKTWMFLPYILALTIGSVIHTKIWYKKNINLQTLDVNIRKTFLQRPTFNGMFFRVRSDIKQFCTQALPIFILICFIAAILEYLDIIHYFSYIFLPLLLLLNLPTEAAAGLAFSIIRKDGILIFNEGNGLLLSQLTNLQLFLLVFLASTITACLVTMLTIWKEFGYRYALQCISRQFITSILCTFLIIIFMQLVSHVI